MKLGIAILPADFAIRPDELARAVEDRGFESLFFTDHTHVPAFRSRMGASAGAGSEEALAGRPGRAWVARPRRRSHPRAQAVAISLREADETLVR